LWFTLICSSKLETPALNYAPAASFYIISNDLFTVVPLFDATHFTVSIDRINTFVIHNFKNTLANYVVVLIIFHPVIQKPVTHVVKQGPVYRISPLILHNTLPFYCNSQKHEVKSPEPSVGNSQSNLGLSRPVDS
jgi:hypothetical protein